MSLEQDLLIAVELHSVERIHACFGRGASPTKPIHGKTPVEHLIEMYTRSDQFPACLRTLLEAGAVLDDPLLRSVLLEDADALREWLRANPQERDRRLSFSAAYTCCRGVRALHVCAEFNSIQCARVLIEAGADVNARAGMDAQGLGGQTPIFHSVNSNHNYCRPMLELLVESGADLVVRLKGLVWGEAMDWETVLFDVTVFSYAQCGLYKQFHRDERDIYSNLALMYERRYRAAAPVRNVPNKYLTS